MKKNQIKVFIETSVLLSSSVNFHDKYKHKNYDPSKSLFNLFEKQIMHQVGWTSDTVIDQSKEKLMKVVNDVINETERTDLKINNPVKYYDIISKMKDNAEDRLKKNIRLLTKMPTDENVVMDIKSKEVVSFFIDNEKQRRDAGNFNVSGMRLKSDIKRQIRRTNIPAYKGIPDYVDLEIFSEAIYLKRMFLKEGQMFVASLDTHFAPPKKDCIVRDKIKEKFNIICDWPEKIFLEIQKKFN